MHRQCFFFAQRGGRSQWLSRGKQSKRGPYGSWAGSDRLYALGFGFRHCEPRGARARSSRLLENNQNTALAINSITASGNYSQANNCPTSLAAGASCTLNVTFVPTVKGTVSGAITVTTDALLAAQPVGLTGIGSGTATPNVSFTPASLDFANQEAGTESAAKTVALKNTSSSSSLTITSIGASAGYASTDTCAGKIIPAGGTCTISVKFQPTANLVPVAYPGAITVVDSDATATQVLALAGFGVAPVSPSPISLDVGVVYLTRAPVRWAWRSRTATPLQRRPF